MKSNWFVPLVALSIVIPTACLADNPPTFSFQWGSQNCARVPSKFCSPRYIAYDAIGNIYVTDTNNNQIQEFTASGVYIKSMTSGTVFFTPSGIAFDASGNFYAVDTSNHKVFKFNSSGSVLTSWGTHGTGDGQFAYPYPVVVDATGNVYIGDKDNNRVQTFTSTGQYKGQFDGAAYGPGFFRPVDMKLDNNGNILIADPLNNRVLRVTTSGILMDQLGAGFLQVPNGLAVDPTGNIYVSELLNARITKMTGQGGQIVTWGIEGTAPGQFTHPMGMTLNQQGTLLYVVDSDNDRIQVFDVQPPVPVLVTTWSSIKAIHR